MFRTILVPLDGSNLAAHALPFAAALVRAGRGRLVLVRAAEGPLGPEVDPYADDLRARAEIAGLCGRLRAEGLEVTSQVRQGEAADAVARAAAELGADLLVMSTHGRGALGRVLYGSTAAGVLRRAEVPVLLVSPICERPWSVAGPPRVLVPLDGSDLAEEAIGPAGEIAGMLHAELVLLRVVPPSEEGRPYAEPWPLPVAPSPDDELGVAGARAYLDDARSRFGPGAAVGETRVEEGDPAAAIARVAAEEGASMIAMATHGRGGLPAVLMGSVAHGTLRRATVPLLLVRPAGLRRATGSTGAAAAPADGDLAASRHGEREPGR
jgi:nucleotide-binding universal stress UspA family protein